jgi:hypothetical protein
MDGSVVGRSRMDVMVDVRESGEYVGVFGTGEVALVVVKSKKVALQKCPSFSHFHCSTNTCSTTRAA